MTKKPYSLRERLLWSLFISMVFILGSIGLVANQVSQHEAEEIFSARLATSARVLEALLAPSLGKATLTQPIVIRLPEELEHAEADQPTSMGHPYESKLAFQVWSEEGLLLAKSATAPFDMLGPRVAGFHEHPVNNEIWQVFTLQSGALWIFAAERNDVREEMVDELSLAILTPLTFGGFLLLFVTNFLAIRSVKPVRSLAKSISQRDPNSLEPIGISNMPRELQSVVSELNALLDRVRAAFVREQRFTDSAAHELRTPITAIHIHLQNAEAATRLEDIKESIAQAVEASRRAKKLAEQLLVYSRVSSSVGLQNKSLVDLVVVSEQVVGMMAPIVAQREQQIKLSCVAPVMLLAERTKIESLIQNLIENASLYGATPGVIVVSVTNRDKEVVLTVENDGSSIPDDEKAKVFIPHYRTSGSKVFGTGLGLAIVQEIAVQHGAKVEIEDKSPGSGVRVRVVFQSDSEKNNF